jgi:hypothetical protein
MPLEDARLARRGGMAAGLALPSQGVVTAMAKQLQMSRGQLLRIGARLSLFPLLALTVVAGLLMGPSSARAASGRVLTATPGASWALGGALRSATTSNVLYHGGPVMAGEMQVYAIFWEPAGSFVSSKFNMLIKRYFRDVGDSGLYANNGQYADTSGQAPAGAELAGTFVDRSAYPSTPVLQDSDIRNEVTHAMSVEGWTPGITHLFFVYTALNESICVAFFGSCSPPFGSMCGYHFGFRTPGGVVLYAGMPYAGNSLAQCYGLSVSPNRDVTADAEVNLTSHEQMESATDPEASGWFGPGGLTDEIADKCLGVFGPLNAKGGDVYFKGHPYILQEEWDNAVSGCVLTGP